MPRGVLETILLNNQQLRLPATGVVAVDIMKSTIVYRAPDGALPSARFSPANLTVVEQDPPAARSALQPRRGLLLR